MVFIVGHKLLKIFLKDYIMVVGKDCLADEVPYLGGKSELQFFVEGLRFPDKDFDGFITINLSLTEPSGKVRAISNETSNKLQHCFTFKHFLFSININDICI